MADDLHQPHDHLVRTVLRDLSQAASFLRAYLPEPVRDQLQWDTLRLLEGSFIDEHLRSTEADLLDEIERVADEDTEPVWLYLLLEHQSTPDRWMPFRLLKYCCRIWDASFRDHPGQRELRAIVPLVFDQGARRWMYSTELADLFAEPVREWPGAPRCAHGLIDQSQMTPESSPRARVDGL